MDRSAAKIENLRLWILELYHQRSFDPLESLKKALPPSNCYVEVFPHSCVYAE